MSLQSSSAMAVRARSASSVGLRRGGLVIAHWTTFQPRKESAYGIVLSLDDEHCELGLVDAVDLDQTCSIDVWDLARHCQSSVAGLLGRARPGSVSRTSIVNVTLLSSSPRLESRLQTRVNTRESGVLVSQDDGAPWPMVDVSMAGFAVQCPRAFRRDERVHVVLTSATSQAAGTVVVRHCRESARGWYHCGVRIPPYSPGLADFVKRLSTDLERDRLERILALQRAARVPAR